MKIGVPIEIKNNENRVGMTPSRQKNRETLTMVRAMACSGPRGRRYAVLSCPGPAH